MLYPFVPRGNMFEVELEQAILNIYIFTLNYEMVDWVQSYDEKLEFFFTFVENDLNQWKGSAIIDYNNNMYVKLVLKYLKIYS